MNVKVFLPCEKVVNRRSGNTDVLGIGLENVFFPATEEKEYHETIINFFCIIDFEPLEAGNVKTCKVALVCPDGSTLSETKEFNFKISEEKASKVRLGGEFPIKTNKSGRHSMKLVVDHKVEAEWPLNIKIGS